MPKRTSEILSRLLNARISDDVSELIKAWREAYDLTQSCAAYILGVAPRTLQGWELGRPMPFPRMLQTAIFSYVENGGNRAMILNNLPKNIGDRMSIPAWDKELRREVEGRGFLPEQETPKTCIMRRDFDDGALKTDY